MYELLSALLLLSTPFFMALPNILIILLTLLWVWRIYKKEVAFASISNLWLTVLFVYLSVKAVFFETFLEDSRVYGRFLLIFLLPIVLSNVRTIVLKVAFIGMSCLAIAIAGLRMVSFYFSNGNLPFSNGDVVNRLLIVERPYFGFICLISIIFCVEMGKLYYKRKFIFIALGFLFAVFIFLIAARLSLLTLIVLALAYLFFQSGLKTWHKLTLIAAGAACTTILLMSYGNLSERFLRNASKDRIHLYDPRVVIWTCASEISQAPDFNIVTGLSGYTEITKRYVDCYGTKNNDDLERKQLFIVKEYNSHSQFIDFYLIGGIAGLLLFTGFAISLLTSAKGNFYNFAVAFSLVMFFVLENVFHRQFGCYLIAILLSIIAGNRAVFIVHPNSKSS